MSNDIRSLAARLRSHANGCEATDPEARDMVLAADALERLPPEPPAQHPAMEQLWATQAKYDELIFAVGNKYTGETRHQTALRYIRQAEQNHGEAKCGQPSTKVEK